ncbi:N-6 DNA methylase [Helicobacter sp. L8]|uniref:N-6 DNA methylase n=1 Tax=Helicobacter sp. L8 TaxID=2316078 RepID=UPI000EAEE8B5|nr:N-6 DNA methylase [Helicobacter sp. L8]
MISADKSTADNKITAGNLKEVLQGLNFTQEGDLFTHTYGNHAKISVDFNAKSITYSPQDENFKEGDYPSKKNPSTGFIIHRNTTTNFSAHENFVCLVALHKLLAKGYAPEHIILEPTFKVGHNQQVYGDILLLDQEFKPLVLIENKTYGGEFSKEWNNTQKNGGQLFSYYAVHKVPYLCLLAFADAHTYEMRLVCTLDNEKHLQRINKDRKESQKLRAFADPTNANAQSYFEVWSQTYSNASTTKGIFEEDIQAYHIGKEKYSLKDLSVVSASQISGIYNTFATILRHHSIGNYENSFYILVDLFLCKVIDEIKNPHDLQFTYKGVIADNPFAYCDRLLNLYEMGVKELFNKEVINVKKSAIGDLFKEAMRYEGKFKEKLDDIFDQQKYFNIKKFNFIEVENAQEFYLNFKVLVQVAGLIENFYLSQSEHNQFLGDLFEGFLNKHIHQTEGRFFTPTPITNFIIHSLPPLPSHPKVLDFACGAGHFLTEMMACYKDAQVYGIEKNKDLSKVAKLACIFHNPKSQSQIIFQDALDTIQQPHSVPFKLESFDVILSNPPYSVKGFLSTLEQAVISQFTLSQGIDSKSYENNNAIECFFLERALSFLKKGGLCALILPVSVLQKGGIYEKTRALLLEHFKTLCLVELNSRTFGSTGTQTIILYAQKVEKYGTDLLNALQKARFEGANLKGDFAQNALLEHYCAFRDYPLEDFKAFLATQTLSPHLAQALGFKEYLDDFNAKEPKIFKRKTPTEAQRKTQQSEQSLADWQLAQALEQMHALELEKMRAFANIKSEEVLILKSPPDKLGSGSNKAKIVEFLGYDWSKRKGDEGIKYTSTPSTQDTESQTLSNIQSAKHIQTPLYNPSDPNDSSKLAYKLKSFMQAVLENAKTPAYQEEEGYQLYTSPLVQMLDFSKGVFDLAISLTPKLEGANPFAGCRYALVKLGEVLKSMGKGKRPASFENPKGTIDFYKSSLEVYKCEAHDFDMEALVIGDGGSANVHYVLGKFASSDHTYIFTGLNPAVRLRYVYLVLRHHLELLEAGFKGIALRNIAKKFIENIAIPLPPLQVQEQIIAECAKVEKQYQQIRMGIEQYQALILAVLERCGVCQGRGVTLESLLESLRGLALEVSTDLQGLLKTLPTPPSGGWETISLSDPNKFSLSIGKRVLDSELDPKGKIPVYSANVSKPFGFTHQELLKDYASDCVLWGIDGDWMTAYMPKDTPFYPTDHCGVLRPLEPNIKAQILRYSLQQVGQEVGFCRNLRASIQRVSALKIPLPPLKAQEQIISVLSHIEQEITRLDQEIATLEGKEQEILKEFLRCS